MQNEKILSKLEKLIALAGSSNEHEASLAMEKAMQIAVENNIELSRVKLPTKDEVKKEQLNTNTSRLSVTHRFVCDIIQKYFEVEIITSGNRQTGRFIYFIGKQDKIDFAKFLHSYLGNTFFTLWHKFYSKNPNVTVSTARESYFLGVWQGLSKKLKEAKERAEQAIAEEIRSGYSLMLTTSEAELKEAVVKFFPEVRYNKAKATVIKSSNALESGFNDGQKINVYSGLEHKQNLAIA